MGIDRQFLASLTYTDPKFTCAGCSSFHGVPSNGLPLSKSCAWDSFQAALMRWHCRAAIQTDLVCKSLTGFRAASEKPDQQLQRACVKLSASLQQLSVLHSIELASETRLSSCLQSLTSEMSNWLSIGEQLLACWSVWTGLAQSLQLPSKSTIRTAPVQEAGASALRAENLIRQVVWSDRAYDHNTDQALGPMQQFSRREASTSRSAFSRESACSPCKLVLSSRSSASAISGAVQVS